MNLLDLTDEKYKDIKVRGMKFKIKYISPMDRIQISRERMALQGGNPIESMTADEFVYFENIAIVNSCTEELPDGFNENESCVNWSDIDLINEVAGEIRKHTEDIESKLKKNRPITN